jgi:hypothetical protein
MIALAVRFGKGVSRLTEGPVAVTGGPDAGSSRGLRN